MVFVLRGNQLSWFSRLSLLQCVGTQCMSLASLETRTIVYHWFSLGTSGSQRLPMVLSGYLWFSMVLSGYQWFSVVTSDSQRLPVVLNGISGYQWKLTYPISIYQVPKCIEPLMGSYSMYLHVPKNLFSKWHSVRNTVKSQRTKTFQQSCIDIPAALRKQPNSSAFCF